MGVKRNKLHFYKKCVHPMLQKGNYLKLERRYVKTVFRNGIYDKLCIRMGVFCIFDKIEENRYFFTGLPVYFACTGNINKTFCIE